MQKCLGGVGVGGRRETGLQLSAIFNVGYVLGTSLGKEAGNTTLEFDGVLFQPKYGRRKRRFRERSCCDAGKNTFTSQFVATRSISWKERLKFAVR